MPIKIGSPKLSSSVNRILSLGQISTGNLVTRLYPSEETTHLGIIRAELKENKLNVEARISLARRTLFSLINTGVHGSNGLNPKVSFKIYQC